MANRAFRSRRGLIKGFTLLLMSAFTSVGLSACGAPSYNYAADTSAGMYYKVPNGYHQISQQDMNAVLKAVRLPTSVWKTAFDAGAAPSAGDDDALDISQPFVFAEVVPLSATQSNALSYNTLRDFWLPVTSAARQAASHSFTGTNFTQLTDTIIKQNQGVHGVRETFQYTFGTVTDTFDEEVLTNADQTVVYTLQLHCTKACYSDNQNSINTVMSSLTVGNPT